MLLAELLIKSDKIKLHILDTLNVILDISDSLEKIEHDTTLPHLPHPIHQS